MSPYKHIVTGYQSPNKVNTNRDHVNCDIKCSPLPLGALL